MRTLSLLLLMPFIFIACSKDPNLKQAETPVTSEEARKQSYGKLFGEDVVLFGGDPSAQEKLGSGAITVNSYLWRAALDTVSFMPLQSADPFGGVVITDWYSPPETPSNRYKITIYILDTQLRANGIRASIFKEKKNKSGSWSTVKVADESVRKIEDAILTRARQLRINSQS